MDFVPFGRTGIRVSKLCMGAMTFGKEADEPTSMALMDRAVDVGINFLDTANMYGKGRSEEIVGRWLAGKRDTMILATKVYCAMGDGPNDWGSSRRNILMAVEQSLKRLKTDWIDLLYLHLWDDYAHLEQSLTAMTTLVEQGKVMYCGVSNFAAWQTMKALAIADAKRLAPMVCIQPMYSLVKRQVEVELLPLARSEHLAVCPYSPLGAGMLTGKYQRRETGRVRENDLYRERFKNPQYTQVTERFVAHAASLGLSPGALALAWVSSHPDVTSTLIGARNLDQLNDNLGCLDIHLTAEDRAKITALSIDPPLATDR